LNIIHFIPDVLLFLSVIGESKLDKSMECVKLYDKIRNIYNSFHIERISEITGNDLKTLGIREGVIFGKLLRRAQYYLVVRKCITKDEALKKIKKYGKGSMKFIRFKTDKVEMKGIWKQVKNKKELWAIFYRFHCVRRIL